MDSSDDTPKGWVAPFGHPRINACSRLPMAFRSVPRPSSPPGAKASTECPSYARDHRTSPRRTKPGHHVQEPSSEPAISLSAISSQKIAPAHSSTRSAHNRFHPKMEPNAPERIALLQATRSLESPVRQSQQSAPRDAPEPDSHFQRTTSHTETITAPHPRFRRPGSAELAFPP